MIRGERELRRSPGFSQRPCGWVCIEEVQDCHQAVPTGLVESYLTAWGMGVLGICAKAARVGFFVPTGHATHAKKTGRSWPE